MKGDTMKERLDFIDIAKGILIVLVVVGHVWQSGPVFDTIYAFHMPGFFIIGGMLMQYTKAHEKPFGKFVLHKAVAYGIPFIWIEILGVLTDIIRNGATLNIKGYLYNTLMFNFNDPNLWFIVTLFLIELTVAAMVKLIKKPWIICGIAGILFFARYAAPEDIPVLGTVIGAARYLPLFIVGFYGSSLLKKANAPAAALCAAVVLGRALLESTLGAMGRIWLDLSYLVSGCCGTYAVLCIGRWISLGTVCKALGAVGRAFGFAGRSSVVIYGTHHIIYVVLGMLLGVSDFASTPFGTGMIILVGTLLIEIPIVYVVNRWLPFLMGKPRRRNAAVS